MTQPVEKLLQEGGVSYFGSMTASVSHEIKNCLAIMNENTGLMTDLILLSQKRPPLDLERIQGITERITGQIFRADNILKNLNLFSHSMDKAVQPVDLSEAIQLATALGKRICENRRVTILHQPPENPIKVTVPFFFLLNLIWTVLEGAVEILPPGAVLDMTCIEKRGGAGILFSSEAPFGTGVETAMASLTGRHLLTLISAEVAIDSNNQRLELILRPSPAYA